MSDIVMPNEVVLRMKLLRVYSVFVRQLSGYAFYEPFRECEAKICGETVSAGCGVLAGWIKAVPLIVYDYYPNLGCRMFRAGLLSHFVPRPLTAVGPPVRAGVQNKRFVPVTPTYSKAAGTGRIQDR